MTADITHRSRKGATHAEIACATIKGASSKSRLGNVDSYARDPVAKDVFAGEFPTDSAEGTRLTLLDHVRIVSDGAGTAWQYRIIEIRFGYAGISGLIRQG